MKKAFTTPGVIMLALFATAQQDTTQKMDEVFVYANKFAEKKKNITQKIEIISAKTIAKPVYSERLTLPFRLRPNYV